MLFKDAKRTIAKHFSTTSAEIFDNGADEFSLTCELSRNEACCLRLQVGVERGKGNASVWFSTCIELLSLNSIADSGFEVEPDMLDGLPAHARKSIVRLRRRSAHLVAFLDDAGAFSMDFAPLGRNGQIVEWTIEELNASLNSLVTRANVLAKTHLPGQQQFDQLVTQRIQLTRTLFGS